MLQYTVTVEGMACSMCEAHVNEAVRRNFPAAKKVTSSHSRGQTQILSETPLDADALRQAISATGYRVLSVQSAPYEKKGLFSRRK